MSRLFGWSLPPGVTSGMIDAQFAEPPEYIYIKVTVPCTQCGGDCFVFDEEKAEEIRKEYDTDSAYPYQACYFDGLVDCPKCNKTGREEVLIPLDELVWDTDAMDCSKTLDKYTGLYERIKEQMIADVIWDKGFERRVKEIIKSLDKEENTD